MAKMNVEITKFWKTLANAHKSTSARDLVILHKKDGLLAIKKPYGLPVIGGTKIETSLTSFLPEVAKYHGLPETPSLCHRLDKYCTGVLLLSYNTDVAREIANMFHKRLIKKEYLAVTIGQPEYHSGSVVVPLGPGRVGKNRRIVLRKDLINKTEQELKELGIHMAKTEFKVLDSNRDDCSLLSIITHTGYKHQVRAHLADGINTPILGDHKFSSTEMKPQTIPLRMMQLLGINGINGKIQPWQRACIPLHLFAQSITIKDLMPKPIFIRDTMPDYFKYTLSSLHLNVKKEKLLQNQIDKILL